MVRGTNRLSRLDMAAQNRPQNQISFGKMIKTKIVTQSTFRDAYLGSN